MTTQLPWMKRVVVGSVLQEASGAMRVVRNLTRGPAGDLKFVTFTIRHCSWTGRCYTVVTVSDLKTRGFRLVRVRPRALRTRLDAKVRQSILGNESPGHYTLTCCDVEGVA
jgi:hypothetical protein